MCAVQMFYDIHTARGEHQKYFWNAKFFSSKITYEILSKIYEETNFGFLKLRKTRIRLALIVFLRTL